MEGTDGAWVEAVGRNLRAERARRDLTQEALARMSGLGVTQVARMERGETDSGLSKYLRLAAALQLDPVALFYGIDLNPVPDSPAAKASRSPGRR